MNLFMLMAMIVAVIVRASWTVYVSLVVAMVVRTTRTVHMASVLILVVVMIV